MVLGDAAEVAAIHRIQPPRIDFQPGEGGIRDGAVDLRLVLDGSEVPHPAQQAPGDAGRPAGAAGDFLRAEVNGKIADIRGKTIQVSCVCVAAVGSNPM